ncbi:MAG: flavin reductase family protein [Flavobacteriales bacterium]|jgi:flavin reductase (DIM6/NTAB) family NADH-FMN oxidoreductase RutF|nr:flavin reductase family protein [Flavobacteriales bacterium]
MIAYTTLDPNQLDQKTVHHHLLSAVVPRPICFASTIDAKGNVNLSPFSFFNVFSSNPPVLIFSPARSGKDNSMKHTLTNVMEVDEVVINIIDHPIVEQMSLSSTPYKKGVNEFVKSGLTQLESTKIKPPRVGEAPIAFECKVQKLIPLGKDPGAGNLVIAEVLLMHFQDRYLNSEGMLVTEKINWVARMGGSWYAQIRPEALFQIPKPNSNIGIGVDQLPQSVQNSTVLTGNNLGRLGNIDRLPTQTEIAQMKQSDPVLQILSNFKKKDQRNQLHQMAQQELVQKNDYEALTILMVSDQMDY